MVIFGKCQKMTILMPVSKKISKATHQLKAKNLPSNILTVQDNQVSKSDSMWK